MSSDEQEQGKSCDDYLKWTKESGRWWVSELPFELSSSIEGVESLLALEPLSFPNDTFKQRPGINWHSWAERINQIYQGRTFSDEQYDVIAQLVYWAPVKVRHQEIPF